MFHYEHLSEPLLHTMGKKTATTTTSDLLLKRVLLYYYLWNFADTVMSWGDSIKADLTSANQALLHPPHLPETSPSARSGSHLKDGGGCFPPSWGGNGQQSSV